MTLRRLQTRDRAQWQRVLCRQLVAAPTGSKLQCAVWTSLLGPALLHMQWPHVQYDEVQTLTPLKTVLSKDVSLAVSKLVEGTVHVVLLKVTFF